MQAADGETVLLLALAKISPLHLIPSVSANSRMASRTTWDRVHSFLRASFRRRRVSVGLSRKAVCFLGAIAADAMAKPV